MTMAMPSRGRDMVKLMVTLTIRTNMPRVITTTKDMVMAITTKGMTTPGERERVEEWKG